MALIADGLLLLAAAVAALYCYVLSRRLERLNGLEGGLGKAITSLSDRVDQMAAALELAKSSTEAAATQLRGKTLEADQEIKRLTKLIDSAKAAHAALTIADDAARKAERRRPAAATEAAEVAQGVAAAFEPPAPAQAAVEEAPAAEIESPPAQSVEPQAADRPAARVAERVEAAPQAAEVEPTQAPAEEAAPRAAAPAKATAAPAKRTRAKASEKTTARRRGPKPKAKEDTELANEIGSIIAEGKGGDKDAMLRRLIAVLGEQPKPNKENAA